MDRAVHVADLYAQSAMAKMAEFVHDNGGLFKVIAETDLWGDEELKHICGIVSKSGADFFKTSTGYHRQPVNIKTVKFLRKHLPESVRIKASGGIKDPTQAKYLIEAGAERLGSSNALELVVN